MLKHILLFKFKEENKAKNAEELKDRLNGLKAHIPELLKMEAGVNTGKSPRAWDVSLYSEFKDFAALDVYQKHPAHLEVVKFVDMVCEDRHVVDYEI